MSKSQQESGILDGKEMLVNLALLVRYDWRGIHMQRH